MKTEEELRIEAKAAIKDRILDALRKSNIIVKLSDGKIGEADTDAVRFAFEGDFQGLWPLPGESGRVQHDFTITSVADSVRNLGGMLVAVQKTLLGIVEPFVESVVLLDTAKVKEADGTFSRNDLFAAIVKVAG